MKKRTREIDVDGTRYVWLVTEFLWPARVLRIWKGGESRRPWIEHEDRGLAPWTPALVAELIKRRLLEDEVGGEHMDRRRRPQ